MKLKKLRTNFLGRNIFYFKSIDSTQKEVWRRVYSNDIKNGTLVFSDIQTSAIGTHGRKWYTDEENNISFSFYIRINCNVEKLKGITIEIAEVIKQILKEKYDVDVQIKEPNDIYYNGKKLGGILTETKIISEKAKCLVIGIGINTNKKCFEEDIKNIATSIKNEFGIVIKTTDFIVYFCNEFEKKVIEKGLIKI